MIKYLFLIFLFLISCILNGQNFQIKGKIFDSESHLPVGGATIRLDDKISTSDKNGIFSVSHEKGTFQISIKYNDYKEMLVNISIFSDTSLVFYYEKEIVLNEVKVIGNRITGFSRSENQDIIRLNPSELSFLPGLGSTDDILKKIQLLPGINSGGEGSAGLIVRGGQYDQNLIILNGFPLYQPYHMSGFISSIDQFMISDMDIMKGGFRAKYGGRLSSVIKLNIEDSIKDTVLSKIFAGILISGAAIKFSPDTLTSVSASGKIGSTYVLNNTLNRIFPDFPFYNFFDINVNLSRILNERNKISFTLFVNKDEIKKTNEYSFYQLGGDYHRKEMMKSGWNETMAGLSWTDNISSNLKLETRLFYHNFFSGSTMSLHSEEHEFDMTYDAINTVSSYIKETGLTGDLLYYTGKNVISVGLFSYFRSVAPVAGTFFYLNGIPEVNNSDIRSPEKYDSQLETGIYIEDQYFLNDRTLLRPGIRLSLFTDFGNPHLIPEPRIFISHKLNSKLSLIGSYTVTSQAIQRITSSGLMAVNDLWVPATRLIKPSRSYQGELGLHFDPGKVFRSELTLYYKKFKDLYMYKEGASFAVNPRLEDNITTATGNSYGAELLMQAQLKNIFLLLAYTISKTTRQSPEINEGKTFNFTYDRPHDLNITAGYRVNNRLNLSLNWTIQSGKMITFYDRVPQEYYEAPGPFPYLDEVNNIRFPVYHRLDLGLERTKIKKWGKRIFKLDIYNLYSKLNPWYLSIIENEVKQVTLFPIIPSISYNVEF